MWFQQRSVLNFFLFSGRVGVECVLGRGYQFPHGFPAPRKGWGGPGATLQPQENSKGENPFLHAHPPVPGTVPSFLPQGLAFLVTCLQKVRPSYGSHTSFHASFMSVQGLHRSHQMPAVAAAQGAGIAMGAKLMLGSLCLESMECSFCVIPLPGAPSNFPSESG